MQTSQEAKNGTTHRECKVCFDHTIKNVLCNGCNTNICYDCFLLYIDHCMGNITFPACVKCKKLYTDIKCLSIDDKTNYYTCVLYYYVHSKKDDYYKMKSEVDMIETLRNAKIKFLYDKLPKAIAKVAEIIGTRRLRKMNIPKSEVSKPKKLCPRTTCVGILDTENFICKLCKSAVCRDCEQLKSDVDHKCSKETKETLEFLRSDKQFRNCPNCYIIIYKYEGCDHMTCASCKHRFAFSTGESITQGSHNKQIENQTKKVYTLRSKLSSFNNIDPKIRDKLTELIIEFENMKPTQPSDLTKTISTIIESYIKSDNDIQVLRKHALSFYKKLILYTNYEHNIRMYTETYDLLYISVNENSSISKLNQIINNYQPMNE
jgi:hypothetical protein